jgi:hypothetical protein
MKYDSGISMEKQKDQLFKKEGNMLRKIQFIRFTVLGVTVLSLILAGCLAKKTIWGDPQTGLILEYRIPQDQSLQYKNTSETNQTIDMMGQSMKISTKILIDYSIKGTATDDQNNLLTQVNINDFSMLLTGMQGETTPDTSALKGKSFGVSFSTKGKEIGFTGIKDLPKIDLGMMSGGEQGVDQFFQDLLPDLPAEPVKVGATWTEPIDNKIQQGPLEVTTKGEATNILEGLDTIKGMECVRIKSTTKSTVQGSGEMMGNEMNIKGEVKSLATWYFAYKKGLFIKASVEQDTDVKITAGSMGEIPQSSKMKLEIELIP